MSKTKSFYQLNKFESRIAENLIKGYYEWNKTIFNFNVFTHGKDEQGNITPVKTAIDFARVNDCEKLVKAINKSHLDWVDPVFLEPVWAWVVDNKPIETFDDYIQDGLRLQKRKWLYGFAKEFGINYSSF